MYVRARSEAGRFQNSVSSRRMYRSDYFDAQEIVIGWGAHKKNYCMKNQNGGGIKNGASHINEKAVYVIFKNSKRLNMI